LKVHRAAGAGRYPCTEASWCSIGSISGSTNICGATSNVPYDVPSVAGATSYTWTVPPGANIGSGQGTNSIMVNYPAGSSSGDVTVFAISGACQTTTAILSVAVSSTAIASPTSGGDQTATSCPPNPTPTLTATANVPAGHTVVWSQPMQAEVPALAVMPRQQVMLYPAQS